MLLLTHILIACSSLAFAAYVYLRPSTVKLRVSYGFIAATVSTGTALIIVEPATMLHACMSGMIYIGIASVMTAFTHKKFATQIND